MRQLEEIEERVRQIIRKKADEVQQLQEELRLSNQTCKKLEDLMERQRRDLMMKL